MLDQFRISKLKNLFCPHLFLLISVFQELFNISRKASLLAKKSAQFFLV